MEENELQQNVTTDKLVSDIHNIIEQGRQQAYAVANQVAVLTYWHIGRRIVEEEQHGKARAQYGTRLIKTLAEQLMPKYGSTFSKRNLDYFRQFYLCFNDLEIVNTRVHNLTWSHFRSIIQIADPKAQRVVCKRGIGADVECKDTQSQHWYAILWTPYGLCKGRIGVTLS